MLRKILSLSTALTVATFLVAVDAQPAQAAYDFLTYRAQVALSSKGFDVGKPDGVIGPKTRAAISSYQRASGITATGQVSQSLVTELEGGRTATPPRAERQPTRAERDRIRDRDREVNNRDGQRLSQAELITQTQSELRRIGYGITVIGGRLNGETSDAIRDYQQRRGMEQTGMPSRQLLAQMRGDRSNVMGRGISAPEPLPPVSTYPSYPTYPTQGYPTYPAQTYPVAPARRSSAPTGCTRAGRADRTTRDRRCPAARRTDDEVVIRARCSA